MGGESGPAASLDAATMSALSAALGGGTVDITFSEVVRKINKYGKLQKRTIVLANTMMVTLKVKGKAASVQRQDFLYNLLDVKVSDTEVVVQFPDFVLRMQAEPASAMAIVQGIYAEYSRLTNGCRDPSVARFTGKYMTQSMTTSFLSAGIVPSKSPRSGGGLGRTTTDVRAGSDRRGWVHVPVQRRLPSIRGATQCRPSRQADGRRLPGAGGPRCGHADDHEHAVPRPGHADGAGAVQGPVLWHAIHEDSHPRHPAEGHGHERRPAGHQPAPGRHRPRDAQDGGHRRQRPAATKVHCVARRFTGCWRSERMCAASVLLRDPPLQSYDISCNDLEEAGMILVADVVACTKRPQESLTVARLKSQALGTGRLLQSIQHNVVLVGSLRSLDLSGNTIGPAAADSLSSLFAMDAWRLERLFVNNCQISDEGVAGCLVAAARCPTLKELSVSKNAFGDVIAVQLCAGIAANPTLEVLNVSFLKVSARAIEALVASAFRSERQRMEMDISGNDLGDYVGVKIASILSESRIVHSLAADHCELGHAAISWILKGLTGGPIARLSLSSNGSPCTCLLGGCPGTDPRS